MNDSDRFPENAASIDCPNAWLPMSYAQPNKQEAIRRLGPLSYVLVPAATRDCGRALLPKFGFVFC